MKDYVRWFGLLAVLHSGLSQGADRSPFETYRPFNADEPLMDWRAANEQVREAGGHLGLMKTDKKTDEKAGKADAPAAGSHAGHGSHTPPAGGNK
jgi:hypothetical protein